MSNSPTLSELAEASKQNEDKPLRSAVEIAMSDDDRQRRRRIIKTIMAKNAIIRRRQQQVRTKLSEIDSELDTATNEHAEVCQPIQTALQEFATKEIESMVDGRTVDSSLDEQRDEWQIQLDAANEQLQSEIDRAKKLRKVYQLELQTLEKQVDSTISQHALAHPSVANPALLDEQFVCQQRLKFAEARRNVAAGHVEKYQHEISLLKQPRGRVATTETIRFDGSVKPGTVDHETIATYETRLGRWELELVEAAKEFNAAMEASDEMAKRIREE